MIKKIEWNGIPAISIEAGGYQALLVPSIGSNLISLKNIALGIDILRTPRAEDMETFTSRPQIFGLPLLFPPNRIEDGTYTHNGRKYQYPITIADQNNYHHGIIKSAPFTVARCEDGEDKATVQTRFFSNCFNNEIFEHFPHNFECRMTFTLSDKGLEHTVKFKNLDKDGQMPIGVGYHTPFNIPFKSGTTREDYRIQASLGKRWILSERGLPTGEMVELDQDLAPIREEGIYPFFRAMDASFTVKPIVVDGKPFHGAIISESKSGHKVFYIPDSNMKHWVLWNNGANVPWFCPEPQSWAINAPNLKLSKELTDFTTIPAGGKWSSTSRIYAI